MPNDLSPSSNSSNFSNLPHVFVVGSPRSGTTMLASALGAHPELAYYYEPYFIWDNVDGAGEDDVRKKEDVTAKARAYITKEFEWFLTRSGRNLIVEKTPENSFRIDYINEVFPNARFIHIIRDGYEAVFSLNREWKRRETLVEHRRLRDLVGVIKENFVEYPYWRCRVLLILYELKTRIRSNSKHLFNKSKWKGTAGYGPRYADWEKDFTTMDLITFNATQWRRSVEACIDSLDNLSSERVLTLKYEDLTKNTAVVWEQLQNFVGVTNHPDLAPTVRENLASKERKLADEETIEAVKAAVSSTLTRLGYRVATRNED